MGGSDGLTYCMLYVLRTACPLISPTEPFATVGFNSLIERRPRIETERKS